MSSPGRRENCRQWRHFRGRGDVTAEPTPGSVHSLLMRSEDAAEKWDRSGGDTTRMRGCSFLIQPQAASALAGSHAANQVDGLSVYYVTPLALPLHASPADNVSACGFAHPRLNIDQIARWREWNELLFWITKFHVFRVPTRNYEVYKLYYRRSQNDETHKRIRTSYRFVLRVPETPQFRIL